MENNDLNRLHKTLVEILDEIVRVCEEHDIKYFLCGGTLLGAVRHQGFIPWDDDLDIIMPREDYDKFCELCSTELGDKYYLHSAGTDKKYWNTFAKVRKKNTVYISEVSPVKSDEYGIFVDIFPQDRTISQNSRWQRIKNKTIKYLSAVVYCKSSKSKPVGTGLSLFYYLLYFTSVNRIIRFSTRIMVSQNNNPKATYGLVYPAPREIEKEIMPMTVFEPYSRISFEGKEYNAPNDPDYYLTSLYGDYLKLPPVEQRISHTPIRLEFE